MNRRKESGTQIVEFAIVLPIIILLALIVAEGANMFRVHQLVTNAAREGARLAILPQNAPKALGGSNSTTCIFSAGTTSNTNPVCNGVATYLQNNDLIGSLFVQCSTITINLNQADVISGVTYSDVQAVCPYQLQNLSKLPFYSIASTVNISSASTFRNFY